MPKAYWINQYHAISNPDALAAYAKLAGPAILAAGGKFVVRGNPVKTYESGKMMRTVVVEFDSLAKAIEVHDGPAYQEAMRALGNAAVRDFRIVEGPADSSGATRDGKVRGYMVNQYHSINDQAALAEYVKLAGTAMAAVKSTFLVRGVPSKTYESGKMERTVVVEFESVKEATDAYEGPEYAKALKALGKAAVRDMRVVEGVA
jgi:uncharacterized protein (DUF1330 family)